MPYANNQYRITVISDNYGDKPAQWYVYFKSAQEALDKINYINENHKVLHNIYALPAAQLVDGDVG